MDDKETIEVQGFNDCKCKCTDTVYYPFSTPKDAKLAFTMLRDLKVGKF